MFGFGRLNCSVCGLGRGNRPVEAVDDWWITDHEAADDGNGAGRIVM